MFLSPTNALLFYTYKMLKYTVKISHDFNCILTYYMCNKEVHLLVIRT